MSFHKWDLPVIHASSDPHFLIWNVWPHKWDVLSLSECQCPSWLCSIFVESYLVRLLPEGRRPLHGCVVTPISAWCRDCKHSCGCLLEDFATMELRTGVEGLKWFPGWCQGLIQAAYWSLQPTNLAQTCCMWLIISFVTIILLQPESLRAASFVSATLFSVDTLYFLTLEHFSYYLSFVSILLF